MPRGNVKQTYCGSGRHKLEGDNVRYIKRRRNGLIKLERACNPCAKEREGKWKMGRGKTAEVGTARVSANGYHYTKTQDRGWVLTHWLTAEKKLGRQIRESEQVRFRNGYNKRDFDNPDAVEVIPKKTTSLRKRRAVLEERLKDLQDELDEINTLLGEA